MRTFNPSFALVLVVAVGAGCAAKIPPDATFDPSAWSRVESLTPGVRVEVRYVTGTPALRHHFEGTLRRAASDVLELQTEDGVQRLLPSRVLQVSAGGRENHVAALGIVGGVLGAVLGVPLAIDLFNRPAVKRTAILGAAIGGAVGALLGLSAGARKGDARPAVVYRRLR